MANWKLVIPEISLTDGQGKYRLTKRELQLLAFLMENEGTMIFSKTIMEKIGISNEKYFSAIMKSLTSIPTIPLHKIGQGYMWGEIKKFEEEEGGE